VPEDFEINNARREELRQTLEKVVATPEEPTLITTIRKGWISAAKPVLVRAIDKCEYVVKGKQAGRQIINDRVVAVLGQAMKAPVGEAHLVEISEDLIENYPEYSYLEVGTAHATKLIPNCWDDSSLLFRNAKSQNRLRFASLAILYGWMHANDHQIICQQQSPYLVYSVDHGNFFVGGPKWTIESLKTRVGAAEPDSWLLSKCKLYNLRKEDLQSALTDLKEISEDIIVQAVSSVPKEWGISIDERLALVEYLIQRQNDLLD